MCDIGTVQMLLFLQSTGSWVDLVLTLCLLVPIADNLCKQFGSRSGMTKFRA